MKKLDSLFTKFKNILDSTLEEREKTAAAVSEVIGAKIEAKDITIKNTDIVLSPSSISPAAKTKIFILREKILAEVKRKTGKDLKSIR